jgi:hypothetical protein
MNSDEKLTVSARRSLVRFAAVLAVGVPATISSVPVQAPPPAHLNAAVVADCVVNEGDPGYTTGGSCG